jgi:N-acetylmuramoyl-L-alanine amidase
VTDRYRRGNSGQTCRRPIKMAAALAAAGLLITACNGRAPIAAPSPHSPSPQSPRTPDASPRATRQGAAGGGGTSSRAPAPGPLAGKIVGIDPGHNGLNHSDPAFLSRQIWNGRESESCDTTGAQTDSGYTEARFNFNVATYLRADLRRDGARVVMTRADNHGLGPCVDRRAEIINQSHANVAIDIHADGGPPSGRGFTVLEPIADGPNDKVINSSVRFGSYVRSAFLVGTPIPTSDYYGQNGIIFRDDLAGLNLTTVPKVLIECGNMRNATDAALLATASVQRRIARALAAAIIRFLTGH